MKDVESLTKLVPLGGLFLLLCSSLKIIFYYKFFNIDIVYFLELSEYPTLFLGDLFYYLGLFCIMIIGFFLGRLSQKKLIQSNDESARNIRKWELNMLIVVCMIITLFFIVISLFEETIAQKLGLLKMGVLQFAFLITFLLTLERKKLNWTIIISIVFLSFIAIDAFIDGFKKIEGNDDFRYYIKLKDKSLTSDYNLKFLGKTEGFLFLYKIADEESIILSSEDLIEIKILPNR